MLHLKHLYTCTLVNDAVGWKRFLGDCMALNRLCPSTRAKEAFKL